MKQLLACLAITCLTLGVLAQEKPFQASLTPDIAIYPKTEPISGLTLSIWGENPQHALAFGFVNGTSGKSAGLSLGLFNYGDSYTGVQWSFVNYLKGDLFGVQLGAVNYTAGRTTGLQLGAVNFAGTLSGLQFGLVNIAQKTDMALQIGFVNVIQQNTIWFKEFPDAVAPGMIFVNWRF